VEVKLFAIGAEFEVISVDSTRVCWCGDGTSGPHRFPSSDAIEQMGRCIPLFWPSKALSAFAGLQRSTVTPLTSYFAISVR
jgi:hypothetical protein